MRADVGVIQINTSVFLNNLGPFDKELCQLMGIHALRGTGVESRVRTKSICYCLRQFSQADLTSVDIDKGERFVRVYLSNL